MKKTQSVESIKSLRASIDRVNESRIEESNMLLNEINKLRDKICPQHKYEFHSKETVDVHEAESESIAAFRFFCVECSYFKVVKLDELNDEWVALIIRKDISVYKHYIQGKYEEDKKIKEIYKV